MLGDNRLGKQDADPFLWRSHMLVDALASASLCRSHRQYRCSDQHLLYQPSPFGQLKDELRSACGLLRCPGPGHWHSLRTGSVISSLGSSNHHQSHHHDCKCNDAAEEPEREREGSDHETPDGSQLSNAFFFSTAEA